jgi:hypothetical protein
MDDELDPAPQRARATLVLESCDLEWPAGPRGLARLESLDEAPLVAVDPEHARGGPVIRSERLDCAAPAIEQWSPSLPGGQEPLVTIEPGQHREHAVGYSPPLSLPGPGVYAIHVEYTWQGGSARSEAVEVRVHPAPLDALVCQGFLGGTASPSLCLLGERAPSGAVRLRLATLEHDGPPRVATVVGLGEVPAGTCAALSIPPQALPTRQVVAYVEGRTLHAITHAYGALARLELVLPAQGYRLLGPPVEDRFEDGLPWACEVLLVREAPAGWALRVASLGCTRELSGGLPQRGPPPRVAHTVAYRDGRRTTLLLGGDEGLAEPLVFGHVVRWQQGQGVTAIEPLPAWPGVVLAAELVATSDGRSAMGAALLREPGVPRVEVHVFEVSSAAASPGPTAWSSYEVGFDVVRGVLRLGPHGRTHAILEGADGRLCLLDPAGDVRELGPELGPAAPPYALVLADGRVPTLLYAEPGVGLRARALGRVPQPRGPA